jgi:hypothetical protein
MIRGFSYSSNGGFNGITGVVVSADPSCDNWQ